MITNERQYKITRSELARLRSAFEMLQGQQWEAGAPGLAIEELKMNALASQIGDLEQQVSGYEILKSGAIRIFTATSLSDLPFILIQARIAKGLGQRELADRLGINEQQIQRYESDLYASASLRRLVEVANTLNLKINEIAELASEVEASDGNLVTDYSRFPIKEMYRRNWFTGFTGDESSALRSAQELIEGLIESVQCSPALSFNRQRVRQGRESDHYSLLAWKLRVLNLSLTTQLKAEFDRDLLTPEFLKMLVGESKHEDGPSRVVEHLREVGIILVIEPHLSRTYLDGAALLRNDGVPVIGMTLRYDRLDNFWFVLFHELVHIIHHLSPGSLEQIFDDMNADADELERATDKIAGEMLLSDEVWRSSVAKFIHNERAVLAVADQLGMSPAIIAGRIRIESGNYTLLSHLVGHGNVRKLFPDIQFTS